MLGSFVAVVTLWANVNSSQSLGRSTKPNISKAAERIFCWGLCPHTHRLLGVRFFGKMKPQVQKKRCQKPPERITIEIIKITSCFPRGAVTPSQSFPCVWAPCAAPCLGATSWVLQQDLRKVDLTPCMALSLQFHIYRVMFSSFCFKSSPKWQEKRLSLESFAKGFEDVQVCPCHQICCHYCSGHHPAGTTAPTRVPAGHTGSAPATAAHGRWPHPHQALLPSPPQSPFPYIKAHKIIAMWTLQQGPAHQLSQGTLIPRSRCWKQMCWSTFLPFLELFEIMPSSNELQKGEMFSPFWRKEVGSGERRCVFSCLNICGSYCHSSPPEKCSPGTGLETLQVLLSFGLIVL